MIELLLIIALGLNGWQFHENGELSQSNKQISQELVEKTKLMEKYYAQVGDHEEATILAEREIRQLYNESEAQAVELESLRNRDSGVDDYLREEIPMGLIGILQANNSDEVCGEGCTKD